MNEVASLDLCKELYELSGWETDTGFREDLAGKIQDGLYPRPNEFRVGHKDRDLGTYSYCPAYSLGYLLRKLPQGWVGKTKNDLFYATYKFKPGSGTSSIRQAGKSPEDALCRLFIELFKQRILTKGTI